MARSVDFNFGANASKKASPFSGKRGSAPKTARKRGKGSSSFRAYTVKR